MIDSTVKSQVESLKVELSESTRYQEKYTACYDELNILKENYTKAASLNRFLNLNLCEQYSTKTLYGMQTTICYLSSIFFPVSYDINI